MHQDWRKILQHHGAHLTPEGVDHFGDPSAELRATHDGTILADLSMQGIIRVDGTDARTFLQGQLSTDVLALTPLTSQLSSWNNSKGRVVTLLRLWEFGSAVHMAIPRSLTSPVQKRLAMYVLRSKAMLTDVSDTLLHFGIAGREAPGVLAICDWSVPTEVNAVAIKDGVTLTRLHGDTPRFVLLGEYDNMLPLWDTLKDKGACPVGDDPWALLRILAGEPIIYPETSEHFVAQMLGLEELGAIDYKKGCYIGQEVIARAHYRGAVKRHLHRASCISSQPIPPGTQVHANGSGQAAGEIVDTCQDLQGKTQMLLVIQDDSKKTRLCLPDTRVISLIE
ncbi:MAG TPA: folate-binding protein [Gammaproteobacteria bacterium]|nr:folate-binding protein [Gammaproteobacteria bacterium]